MAWFSIATGLGSVLLARPFLKMEGAELRPLRCRIGGVREVVSGIGILRGGLRGGPWLWARAVGDVLDLGYFWRDYRQGRGVNRPRLKRSLLAVGVILVLDIVAALLSRRGARRRWW